MTQLASFTSNTDFEVRVIHGSMILKSLIIDNAKGAIFYERDRERYE